MVRSADQKLVDIQSALMEMQAALHGWDDVDDEIDVKIGEIESVRAGQNVTEEIVEKFRKDRDELYKLTSREHLDNVDFAEQITLPALEATAIAGLAIPTAVVAWEVVGLAAVLGGTTTLADVALLTALGAGANAVVGGGANAVGQIVANAVDTKPFFDPAQCWDKTKSHFKWGTTAASSGASLATAAKSFKWAVGIPAAISATALTSVAVVGSSQETADREHDLKLPLPESDTKSAIYSQNPTAYLSLIHHAIQDGRIDVEESELLWQHAMASDNPLIQYYYTQLLAQGAIVTLYRDEALEKSLGLNENICVHFADDFKTRPLMCDPQSDHWFYQSRVNSVAVDSLGFRWFDDDHHLEYASEAKNFKINQPRIPADEGIALVAKYIGVVSFVEDILPKIYEGIFLPEAACVVTHILLNMFMMSDEISSDVKIHYANVLDYSIRRYGDQFDLKREMLVKGFQLEKGKVVTVGEKPYILQTFVEEERTAKMLSALQGEKQFVKKAWENYIDWMRTQLPKGNFAAHEERLKKLGAKLDEVYDLDWDKLRIKISHPEFLRNYSASTTQAYGAMIGPYLQAVDGPYDLFYKKFIKETTDPLTQEKKRMPILLGGSEGGMGGLVDLGLMGWFASSFFLKSYSGVPGTVAKLSWGGALIFSTNAYVSIQQFGSDPQPLALHLPDFNGLASQEYLMMFEERLKAGEKEKIEEEKAFFEKYNKIN